MPTPKSASSTDLDALLESHREGLIHQAFEILQDRDEAEDVVQETFVESYNAPEQLSSPQAALIWLRRVNRTNAVDRLRARKRESRRIQLKQRLVPDASFTTGGFSILELRDAVGRALTALPADRREIVRLHYWEHLDCKTIAGRLKMPEGSVRRVLFESYLVLFQELKRQIPFESARSDDGAPTAKQEASK